MRFCPDDLDPCRRSGCGSGTCQRTGELPLTSCWECGFVVTRHTLVAVCVECCAHYSPQSEEEA